MIPPEFSHKIRAVFDPSCEVLIEWDIAGWLDLWVAPGEVQKEPCTLKTKLFQNFRILLFSVQDLRRRPIDQWYSSWIKLEDHNIHSTSIVKLSMDRSWNFYFNPTHLPHLLWSNCNVRRILERPSSGQTPLQRQTPEGSMCHLSFHSYSPCFLKLSVIK